MTNPKHSDGGGDDEANRRADIIRAAAKLFREKGFEATTVRDIAAAVGMRSGSPFYYFDSKHHMLQAVMEQGLREALARVDAALDPALPASERLRALVRTHFSLLHEAGSEFLSVLLFDWRSLPAGQRSELVELKDRYDAVWQRTLDELHSNGGLGIEPKLARLLILGAINFSATWYRPDAPGALKLESIAEAAARFFLAEAPPHDPASMRVVRAELHALRAVLYDDSQ